MDTQSANFLRRGTGAFAGVALLAAVMAGSAGPASAAPPALTISQLPLTIPMPAHPQILFAMGNSESMDGNLSGAIMTGSGSLGVGYAGLNATSSPVSFTIPAGFTPPINLGAGGLAPYTVNVGGTLEDNSPSRLNVAKAGITTILNTYMSMADFALMDYQNGGAQYYNTMVYEMSPVTGPPAPPQGSPGTDFTFTSVAGGGEQVLNPCYQIPQDNANAVDTACLNLAGRYGAATLLSNQYMNVSASSDDPDVNDILYGGGGVVCVATGPPTLTKDDIADYEKGATRSQYAGGCNALTGPTNAGFVPGSPDVMYIARGFGYGSGENPKGGSLLVGMTSSGAVPTAASVAAAIAKFTPYLAPETNNQGSGEIKAQTFQSPTAGLLAQAVAFWNTHPASSNTCPATPYTVLVTDGLPTMDLDGNNWPPLGSSTAAMLSYDVMAMFSEPMPALGNGNGSLEVTNDGALNDAIMELGALEAIPTPGVFVNGQQVNGVKTYVIGLGDGVDKPNSQAAYTLEAEAYAGGTAAYFPASSPTDLTNDMQAILAQILNQSQAVAATSVNSTSLHNGSVAYLGQFTTSDKLFQDWTGDLQSHPIDPKTGQVVMNTVNWDAQTMLDMQAWDTGRYIATWDPGANGGAGGGTPFEWNPGLAPNGISGTTALGMALQSFAPDPNGQDVLQYLRGSTAQEQRFPPGTFRNRTHRLGDIVNSAPLYVAAPEGYWQTPSYIAFEKKYQNRSPIVYIGANDGMLHAFDATTGAERFAFIPHAVWSNLVKLVNPFYNEQHLFYVNGSPEAMDVQFSNGSWHTVLVGTEGAGGNSVFALDVTDPDAVQGPVANGEATLASMALWEFTDADMGLSYSEPMIADTAEGWLTFFGNGYNSPNEKPILYAVNPQTGALVAKIDLCAAVAAVCNMAAANGLSSVTVENSYGEPTLPADVLYAGDLQGNVWRVNLSDPNPANWVVSVLFQARDPSGNPQPITSAPAVTLNPNYPRVLGDMVYVGTGQLLTLADLATTQIQTLYGIFDPEATANPTPMPTRAIKCGQTGNYLVPQTIGNGPPINGEPVRVMVPPQCPVVLDPGLGSAVRGWYDDFDLLSGERLVTNPLLEPGGVLVVTSYQPNSNSCEGGGQAYLMALNYVTGGSFPLPELDVNGDNNLNSGDQEANGQNPVGMWLGNVFASSATILPSSGGTGGIGARKLTAVSSVNVLSIGDRGSNHSRSGWWEIRK